MGSWVARRVSPAPTFSLAIRQVPIKIRTTALQVRRMLCATGTEHKGRQTIMATPILRRCRSTAVASALFALLALCPVARAQEFQTLPLGQLNGRTISKWTELPNPSSDDAKAIADMLTGIQAMVPAKFDSFFNDIVFPLFTQYQDMKVTGGKMVSPFVDVPGGGYSPAKMRAQFKSTFAAKATNKPARDHFNAITMTKMDEIAQGNFHPICRANAMMMITGLSDGADLDAPWKNALPTILKGITAPTTIDAVRVPALAGLVRHARAQSPIDPDTQLQIIPLMLTLAKQKAPPGQSSDGTDWIARRAIDVLAAMGNPGQNGAVPTTLMAIVDDKAASMGVRTAAAAAVAKIRFTPPANFNAKPWIDSLSKLAVECYKTDLATAAAQRAPIVPDVLKNRLGEVRQGMVGGDGNGGVLALAAAPDKNLGKAVVTQLDNLISKCNTTVGPNAPPTPYNAEGGVYLALPPDPQKDLIAAVEKAGTELEGVIQRGGAPAAAPAPVNGKATPVRETKAVDPIFGN
jgi:hypothetical protein